MVKTTGCGPVNGGSSPPTLTIKKVNMHATKPTSAAARGYVEVDKERLSVLEYNVRDGYIDPFSILYLVYNGTVLYFIGRRLK